MAAISKLYSRVSALSQWTKIPPAHVLPIERLTGISRYKLRSDLHGHSAPKKSERKAA